MIRLRRFFIKQHSTLPELKINLSRNDLYKYGLDEDIFSHNIASTFSMINEESKNYVIANVPAQFKINTDPHKISYEGKYVLYYRFTKEQTAHPGNYLGEFKLDFINFNGDGIGKMTFPNNNSIKITIQPSLTKTTVK